MPKKLCDLHLHIIPGIDDGARTMADSIEILKGLRDCGYRHFIATPMQMTIAYLSRLRHPSRFQKIEGGR